MGGALATWRADPAVLLSVVAVAAGYAAAARPHRTGPAVRTAAALLLLSLALSSPLDALAREYLLTARMTQHLLLSQVVPPLLLLGLPAAIARRALRRTAACRVERFLRRPLVAWMTGIGTLWFWHVPLLFDLSTSHDAIGRAHHMSVLLAGLVFWWPILSPMEEARAGTLTVIGYLASACLASTVLGMALAFSPDLTYGAHRQPELARGSVATLSPAWLTPRTDQQIGGLLMWVPCCVLYVAAIGAILQRWFGAPFPTTRATDPRAAAAG